METQTQIPNKKPTRMGKSEERVDKLAPKLFGEKPKPQTQ
jgi:hypothetical protein